MLKNIPTVLSATLVLIGIPLLIGTFDVTVNADASSAGTVVNSSSSSDSSTTNSSQNDANSSTNQSSSTINSSSDSSSSSSSSSTSVQPHRPTHHYDHVSSFKKVNYDVNLKHGLHKAYQGGPKNTSAKNIRSNSSIKGSAKKRVHVSAQATVKGVKWDRINGQWVKNSAVDSKTHYLNVPLIGQRPQLPTGCEITAVTMMLKYKGAKVNKMMLANKMPRSSNPNKGFVGNPKSPAGQLIYPRGLMKLVAHYAGSAKNMTGASLNQIKAQVQKGHPVVVWVANVDHFPNHALTVYGYDRHHVYYNDPWLNKRDQMTPATLQIHRRADAMRAISY